jgi:hypothetical protein
MKYFGENKNLLLSLGVYVLVISLTITSCKTQKPISQLEISITKTPLLPTPTAASCCVRRDFPPLCDLTPGQSTSDDVKRILGDPLFSGKITPDGIQAGGVVAETVWDYPYSCPVIAYFNGEMLAVLKYPLNVKKSLKEVVAVYRPPEKVRAISYYRAEEDPLPAYWGVIFLWPEAGVAVMGSLLDLQPLDPEAIKLDALPPFPADLPILYLMYYQPTELEEISNILFPDDPLASWPGITE